MRHAVLLVLRRFGDAACAARPRRLLAPPARAALLRRPLRPLCLHYSLSLIIFLSLRVSTVYHPTRKGWKGVYVLALRGVTTKYALKSWRKTPPPPHVIIVGLCTRRRTG